MQLGAYNLFEVGRDGAAEVGIGSWMVSDLHLGHHLVLELRGSASTDQHDEVIVNSLREVPDG